MEKVESVEAYLEIHSKWKSQLEDLINLLRETNLKEGIKWSAPVYSLNGKNIVGLSGFKNHYGLWFFQGVFLKDEHQVLVNAQENKTKALRQWRFEAGDELPLELIKTYVKEAIRNQLDGKEIKPVRNLNFEVPQELQTALDADLQLKKAFNALTPGKQKEYALYIADAKQEATKLKRIQKIEGMILEGIGLNDKYKNC